MNHYLNHYLIGLTGNIATGKSTVARMLAKRGATVLDADKLAHQVMRRESEVFNKIVQAFGPHIVGADGEIDRGRLGDIVFSEPPALRRLEAIVHPAVGIEVQRRIAQATTWVIAIEAIKLIEAGLHRICRSIWVTTCPPKQQIERLVETRSLSHIEAQQRVTAQPPQAKKIERADVVIDTSGAMAETRRQVEAAWQEIKKGENHEHI